MTLEASYPIVNICIHFETKKLDKWIKTIINAKYKNRMNLGFEI